MLRGVLLLGWALAAGAAVVELKDLRDVVDHGTAVLFESEITNMRRSVVFTACEYLQRKAEGTRANAAQRCTQCVEVALGDTVNATTAVLQMVAGADAAAAVVVQDFLAIDFLTTKDPEFGNPLLKELMQVGSSVIACTGLAHTHNDVVTEFFTARQCCQSMAQSLEQVAKVVGLPAASVGLRNIPMMPVTPFTSPKYGESMRSWLGSFADLSTKLTDSTCDEGFGTNPAATSCPCLEMLCRPVTYANSPGDISGFMAAGKAVAAAKAERPDMTAEEEGQLFQATFAQVKAATAGKESLPAFFWNFVAHSAESLVTAGIPEPHATRLAALYADMPMASPLEYYNQIQGSLLYQTAPGPNGQPDQAKLLAAMQEQMAHFYDADAAAVGLWGFASWENWAIPVHDLEQVRRERVVARYTKRFGADIATALRDDMASGQVYGIDLSFLKEWETEGDLWLPGATVLFRRSAGGVRAVALALESVRGEKEIFTRGLDRVAAATDSSWILAALMVRSVFTQVGAGHQHIGGYHQVVGALAATRINAASKDYKVNELLERHEKHTNQFSSILFASFESIFLDTAARNDRGVWMKTMDRFFELRGRDVRAFTPHMYKRNGVRAEDFTSKGGKVWDLYPAAGEAIRLWDKCEAYVKAWVKRHYPKNRDVRNDKDLREWVKAATDRKQGNMRGFGRVINKRRLTRFLTYPVYLAIAHGMARLKPLGNKGTLVGRVIIQVKGKTMIKPTAEYTMKDIMARMPHLKGAGSSTRFASAFLEKQVFDPMFPTGNPEEDIRTISWWKDADLEEASKAFRESIHEYLMVDLHGNPRKIVNVPFTEEHPDYAGQIGNFPMSAEQ